MAVKSDLLAHQHRLITAGCVALWFKFLLPVTAQIFYELYHFSEINFIYWGYSLFKTLAYYCSVWEYHTIGSMLLGLVIASPWWTLIKTLRKGARLNESS
jgi:hypothetical protein